MKELDEIIEHIKAMRAEFNALEVRLEKIDKLRSIRDDYSEVQVMEFIEKDVK